MSNFTDLNAGDPILAADLNALSDDAIDPTSGHTHDGTEGRAQLGSGSTSINMDGRLLWDKGADLASGSTVTPGTDGNYFHITGTTTITAIASLQAGSRCWLVGGRPAAPPASADHRLSWRRQMRTIPPFGSNQKTGCRDDSDTGG